MGFHDVQGKRIGVYEHDGEWLDIGRMDEYLKVNDQYSGDIK